MHFNSRVKSSKGKDLLIALSPFPLLFYTEVHLRIRQPGFTRRAWSKLLPICIPKGSFIGTSSQKTSFWIIKVMPNWWVPAMSGLAKKSHRYYQTTGVRGRGEHEISHRGSEGKSTQPRVLSLMVDISRCWDEIRTRMLSPTTRVFSQPPADWGDSRYSSGGKH